MKIIIIDNRYSPDDSNDILLNGIIAVLNKHQDTEFVGGFRDIDDTIIDQLKEMKFDIILLDIDFQNDRMSEVDSTKGVQWIEKIKDEIPKVKIMMYSTVTTYQNIKNSMANGADGFLNKVCDATELINGINTVLNGKQFLCVSSTSMLVNQIVADELTENDIKILTALAFDPSLNNTRIEEITLVGRVIVGQRLNDVLYKRISRDKQGLSEWARKYVCVSKYDNEIREFITKNDTLKPENKLPDCPYKTFMLEKKPWG